MGVLPDYKEIYELFKKAGNVEAQEQIMQLREEHLRLKEEIISLREDNRTLRERADLTASLKFDSHYYWRVGAEGREGPFCQVCYDGAGKLVRLQRRKTPGAWDCRVCEKYFHDQDYPATAKRYVRMGTIA